jgi:hypothetical protein
VRELADAARIRRFMEALGEAARDDGDCYFTGGATAVLIGWRATTVDVDILLEPEQDQGLRELPSIKDELAVNVELASPADFIPLPEGWRERSISITRAGRLSFRHLDLYSQALAKLERGHAQDIEDAQAMFERNLIETGQLRSPRGRRDRLQAVSGGIPSIVKDLTPVPGLSDQARRIPNLGFELVQVRDESLIDEMRATLRGDRERARKRKQPSPAPAPPEPSTQGLGTKTVEETQRNILRAHFTRLRRRSAKDEARDA